MKRPSDDEMREAARRLFEDEGAPVSRMIWTRRGTMTKWRRKYREGRCQDCGHVRPVTLIRFWMNDYRMRVCKVCIRPYRDRILTNHPHDN